MSKESMKRHKIIAVIPARGGSKRIPKKNIIVFMGKPLIAWTIEAALKSGVFDRIVVSTDDVQIAAVAKEYGIDVPFLRKEANDDISPVSEATISAVKQAEHHWNEKYGIVVQLMPNTPLRGSEEISRAYDNFVRNVNAFQISAFKLGWMNPWWAARLDTHAKPEFIFPEALKKRFQDLEAIYCPTGAIWIAQVDRLMAENTFYGEGLVFFPMPWRSAMDIDDFDDLEMAKAIYSRSMSKESSENVR